MENNTKYRPILFSTPMVQAILEGRKTQTRRVIKPQPVSIDFYEDRNVWYPEVSKCPYNVGDVLWVRETFTEVQGIKFLYKANSEHQAMKWKPSIFMPKEACRIFLKVKLIRVERLQDISEEDAIAEGVVLISNLHGRNNYKRYDMKDKFGTFNPIYSFLTLWEFINGRASWTSNPFVFVYEFEQIEKPLDFLL